MASLLAFGGVVLLTMVFYPLLSYKLTANRKFPTLLSPVDSITTTNTGEVDYTKASNWFPGSVQNDLFKSRENLTKGDRPQAYSISIPTLGIENANVSLLDEDLTKTLVHYPQTALPGQLGSPVIFGHSTLPQFFDQKNYKTIFSTLPKLKVGSDIFVKYDGLEYTYRITKTYEVMPNELWVLRQDYSRKTLKLITCVPPGTTLRRLIIEAELITSQ